MNELEELCKLVGHSNGYRCKQCIQFFPLPKELYLALSFDVDDANQSEMLLSYLQRILEHIRLQHQEHYQQVIKEKIKGGEG